MPKTYEGDILRYYFTNLKLFFQLFMFAFNSFPSLSFYFKYVQIYTTYHKFLSNKPA